MTDELRHDFKAPCWCHINNIQYVPQFKKTYVLMTSKVNCTNCSCNNNYMVFFSIVFFWCHWNTTDIKTSWGGQCTTFWTKNQSDTHHKSFVSPSSLINLCLSFLVLYLHFWQSQESFNLQPISLLMAVCVFCVCICMCLVWVFFIYCTVTERRKREVNDVGIILSRPF